MKLFHLSDLHLGKRVNGFSLLEEQADILSKIIALAEEEAPDAILIAGDLYDKPVPPAEAVTLLDDFLCRLSAGGRQVMLISGNHDSPERLAFGGRLMEKSGIHFSPVYDGEVVPLTLEDRFGPVRFYLLPFLRPASVRRFFPDRQIDSAADAMREILRKMDPDPRVRNILVTHQFVAGALRSDSEEITVGGEEGVDVSLFAPFDYTALGHLHRAQSLLSGRVRYCGTPLKYSFSEAGQEKSVTVVELGEKDPASGEPCAVSLRTLPLVPLRDMAEIKGDYETLTSRFFYGGSAYPAYYLHITLTDEEDIFDAAAKLRVIYPYLMKLDYDNTRTRHLSLIEETGLAALEKETPLSLLSRFYLAQNGKEMTREQTDFAKALLSRIWEEKLP